MTSIVLLPLPGKSKFISGSYGLERCLAQGIIRIHQPPILMSLSISLRGHMLAHFFDSVSHADYVRLDNTLFDNTVLLLDQVRFQDLQDLKYMDIPFELAFPLHDPIPQGYGPCQELLSPSLYFAGGHGTGSVEYILEAKLTYKQHEGFSIFGQSVLNCQVKLDPFLVYDPRMIPQLMNQDTRRWRSSYRAVPLEYDIEIPNLVMGAGDPINFQYRLLVDIEEARRGVRVKFIRFTLNEQQTVGESRCCARDDDPEDYWHKPSRRRALRELITWEWRHLSSGRVIPKRCELSEKPVGLMDAGDNTLDEDGIYCQGQKWLQVPETGGFIPTTPRIIPPPNDNVCKHKRGPFIQVRHSVKVYIEMVGAEPITIESGCYLLSVGRKDCLKVLETEPEIMPPLDYEKVVGLEEWVPEYQERDTFLGQPLDSNFDMDSASEADSECIPYEQALVARTNEWQEDPLLQEHVRSLSQASFNDSRLELFRYRDPPEEDVDVPYLLREAMEEHFI